ncbi:MAG: cytochrome C [Deltaproteobacteria bacterium]|nr:cytochrome C [Deltaproteobacteria bacterium]
MRIVPPRSILVALLIGSGAFGARCQPALGRDPSPSKVIFPVQSIPLSFSHADHLGQDKMDCAFCHEDAPGSTRASDKLIPKEETCEVCHEIERDKPGKEVAPGKPDAKCSSCHPGWDGVGMPPRVTIPVPNLKFNHKLHADRKIRCQECHGDLLAKGVGLATRENLPRMSLCLKCHDSRTAPSQCTTCHVTDVAGQIRTSFPEGTLVPSGVLMGDAHDAVWRTEHARVAVGKSRYCESCHRAEFCVGCHDGVVKPLDFHGNDYVTLHPVDARRNQPDCSSCHRLQTFCTGCHNRSGVGTDPRTSDFQRPSKEGLAAPNRFHPDGWWTTFERNARKSSHHSFQAQRNIRSCASCHREAFCMECHSPAAFNVNPHPSGWTVRGTAANARCRALAARSGRMCLRCHVSAAEASCN